MKRWQVAAAVGALAVLAPLAVWLAITVLRVETPNGTLVVEMDDKDVEARIKNGKLILSGPDDKVRYTLAPSERNKEVAAGAYKVRVEGADGLRAGHNRIHDEEGRPGHRPRDGGFRRQRRPRTRTARPPSMLCPSAERSALTIRTAISRRLPIFLMSHSGLPALPWNGWVRRMRGLLISKIARTLSD